MNESKQYDIPKRVVIDAYKRVKANKGSAGIDGIDFDKFEEKLNNNLYKIWNRMSSGSYFPSPVMAVEIPNKSALDAIEMTRKRCWRYDYVIELDVKGLFDNIDRELLMRVVRRHVKENWICLYIERWLKTPFVLKNGEVIERKAGTPQGGVISPVLANMFLHYVFDMWMKRNFPQAPFERYADDGVVHCKTKEEVFS